MGTLRSSSLSASSYDGGKKTKTKIESKKLRSFVTCDLTRLETAMSGYLYELPTTEPFSFSSCFDDAVGSHTTKMADTTERRANLRTLLKDTKRNTERDYLKLVKVRADIPPIPVGLRPYSLIIHRPPDLGRLSSITGWDSCML